VQRASLVTVTGRDAISDPAVLRLESTSKTGSMAPRLMNSYSLQAVDSQSSFRTSILSMRTLGAEVVRSCWRWSVIGRIPTEPLAVGGVAVLSRCMASGPAGEDTSLERPFSGECSGPRESTAVRPIRPDGLSGHFGVQD
jgi:hypothetical protein